MARLRKMLPSRKGWSWIWDAVARAEATVGSRERAEQELSEHLRAGRLPAEIWRQAGGRGYTIPVPKEYWTLETLRKVQSRDGIEQGGGHNWYQVKSSRLEELYPVATPEASKISRAADAARILRPCLASSLSRPLVGPNPRRLQRPCRRRP